jgi:hypothetical protein
MHGEDDKWESLKFLLFCIVWTVVVLVLNDVIIYVLVKR